MTNIETTSPNTRASRRKMSRRQVMVGAAGLTFAFAFPGGAFAAVPSTERIGKEFNRWLSIAPDGTITIMSAATEMGQGSMTSLPLVLAEELDADWSKVRVVPVPPIDKLYANPAFGMIYTAGSNAVRSYFTIIAHLRCTGAPRVARQCRQALWRSSRRADHRTERRRSRQIGPPSELRRDRIVRGDSGQGARHQAGSVEEGQRLPPDRQGCHAH